VRSTNVLAFLALLAAGCKSAPTQESYEQTVRNQDVVVQSFGARVDELTAQNADLGMRVKLLEAQVEKSRSTDSVVRDAKEEFSAHVREVMQQFRGDRDIQVEETPGGYKFVVRESVLFASASATLTDEGKQVMARVAASLKTGTSRISVEGHTDNVPVAKPETTKLFPRGNIELSVARAISVWETLTRDGGVAEARISVAGFGPHAPLAPNDSDRNRWKNRRVEIRVAED